jgi:hypothetical protein
MYNNCVDPVHYFGHQDVNEWIVLAGETQFEVARVLGDAIDEAASEAARLPAVQMASRIWGHLAIIQHDDLMAVPYSRVQVAASSDEVIGESIYARISVEVRHAGKALFRDIQLIEAMAAMGHTPDSDVPFDLESIPGVYPRTTLSHLHDRWAAVLAVSVGHPGQITIDSVLFCGVAVTRADIF